MQLILSHRSSTCLSCPASSGQESTSITSVVSHTASQAWRNTLTLFLSRFQGSCTDCGSRKTQWIRRRHRWRARSAGDRTKWSATWRPTWNSSAAARETSYVICVRLNTRRISVCVVTFYRGTTSTYRRSSRFLSAFSINKINHLQTIGLMFLTDDGSLIPIVSSDGVRSEYVSRSLDRSRAKCHVWR